MARRTGWSLFSEANSSVLQGKAWGNTCKLVATASLRILPAVEIVSLNNLSMQRVREYGLKERTEMNWLEIKPVVRLYERSGSLY